MAAFRYWRLYVTANDGSAGYVSFSDLALFESVDGTGTNVAPGKSYSQSGDGAVDPAHLGADGSPDTECGSSLPLPYWWQVDLGADFDIQSMRLRSQRVVSGRTPSSFALQGSASPTGPWTDVVTVDGSTGWAVQEQRVFQAASAPGHRHWRFRALTVLGSYLEIGELRVRASGADLAGVLSSSTPPDYGSVGALADGMSGDRCYWGAAAATDPGFWIAIDLGLKYAVEGWRFAGFDTDDRYPSGLTLQWSDNGTDWTDAGTWSGLPYPGNGVWSPQYDLALTPTATLAAELSIAGGFVANFEAPTIIGSIASTLGVSSEINARHGVAGGFAALLDVGGDLSVAHGVAGAMASTLALSGGAIALHPRYTVHGQVKDGGVLVDRRVRVYKRSTGALVAEADTVAGVFDINVGWALDEFYILPIDLSNDATDWAPPVANRVLSTLVSD